MEDLSDLLGVVFFSSLSIISMYKLASYFKKEFTSRRARDERIKELGDEYGIDIPRIVKLRSQFKHSKQITEQNHTRPDYTKQYRNPVYQGLFPKRHPEHITGSCFKDQIYTSYLEDRVIEADFKVES